MLSYHIENRFKALSVEDKFNMLNNAFNHGHTKIFKKLIKLLTINELRQYLYHEKNNTDDIMLFIWIHHTRESFFAYYAEILTFTPEEREKLSIFNTITKDINYKANH